VQDLEIAIFKFVPASSARESTSYSKSWHQKTTEIWIQLTLHSPPPTPLLPPPTLSAGESKVSGGESKVSRRVGLPRSFTRSSLEARNGLPLFLVAFSTLPFCVAMVEPPVSYLEAPVPAAACEMAIIFGSAGCACLARRVLSLRPPRPSYVTLSFLPPLPWQNRRSRKTS
jgi:hypothetical protein